MNYSEKLKYHFKPEKGWINDPNGLVYFNGYYHVFYQHCPNFEVPKKEAVYWGHARTKDFISWEELPVALSPDKPYDNEGCWSGTAIVKDDTLYLFYASVTTGTVQSVSIAYSKDGINFEKYEKNPVIKTYPEDGGPDFRDPAVCFIDGKYRLVMATGHKETKKGRLLIYESEDLFNWNYGGIIAEWDDSVYAECPSLIDEGECILLAASVCKTDWKHFFNVMYGKLEKGKFKAELSGNVDRGPDRYAGQIFRDHKGRSLLMTWIPGWDYQGYAEKDVGCMSVPREMFTKNGKIYGYPVEEVHHLLKDSDPLLKMTDDGFEIERTGRESVVHKGEVSDIKILRDEYIMEVFVNGGETIYTVLL
ncbi:MAG: glycoside hydrolase family 32 protein [Clostridia bacterium]|nr:glycoside hydrolase family 32 protein [Clostridia bacterium]